REVHVVGFFIQFYKDNIRSSIPVEIFPCHKVSICQSQTIAEIFSQIAVPGWSGDGLVILLFNTQNQLVAVICNRREVPLFKREKSTSGNLGRQRNVCLVRISPWP